MLLYYGSTVKVWLCNKLNLGFILGATVDATYILAFVAPHCPQYTHLETASGLKLKTNVSSEDK